MDKRIPILVNKAAAYLRGAATERGVATCDLQQEGLLAGWLAAREWCDGGLNFQTFVYRRVITAMRRALQRGGVVTTPRSEAPSAYADADALHDHGEAAILTAVRLAEVLGDMTPGERQLVIARHGEGQSVAQIANDYDLPGWAVRRRLARCGRRSAAKDAALVK